jgi:hypothetical protein
MKERTKHKQSKKHSHFCASLRVFIRNEVQEIVSCAERTREE